MSMFATIFDFEYVAKFLRYLATKVGSCIEPSFRLQFRLNRVYFMIFHFQLFTLTLHITYCTSSMYKWQGIYKWNVRQVTQRI